jgi:hypothetical protein
MRKLLFIVFVGILSTGCKNETVDTSSLTGVWIEATHKADTLVFNNQPLGLILKRGYEVRNGYYLPKAHSGPYTYEIKNDSINLLWLGSDSNKGTVYYFKSDLNNKLLKIGNFYDDNSGSNEILTFTKIQ